MKTLGLIGGMSWESTQIYYQALNRLARERLGGLHSAELLLWSFDFAEIAALQSAGDWDGAQVKMVDVAQRLHGAGAEALVICTNTMHKMADAIEAAVPVPLLHIADTTAAAIKAQGLTRPLLLATRYTMEEDFYTARMKVRHGLTPLIPDEADRTRLHDIIFNELCQGQIRPTSKEACLSMIDKAQDQGADSVIFGCTEVGLLLSPDDFILPAFDSAHLHARAAIDFALE